MSNYVYVSALTEYMDEKKGLCERRKVDIEVGVCDKSFLFTREVSERVDTTLKRIGIRLAQNAEVARLIGHVSQPDESAKSAVTASKKKSKASKSATKGVAVTIKSSDDTEVTGCTPAIDAFQDGHILCIRDTHIAIRRDPCRVIELKAPDMLIAGCPATPLVSKSKSLKCASRDLKWRWRLWEPPHTAEEGDQESAAVCHTMLFVPPESLIGKKLCIDCTDSVGTTLTVGCHVAVQPAVTSRLATQLAAAESQAEQAENFETRETKAKGLPFRVVSYNILHDQYASTEAARENLYPYVSTANIDITTRKMRIAKELMLYSADIIGLQEVGRSIFCEYLQPVFQCMRMEGFFEPKARIEMKEGQKARVALDDGCAILWNTEKFTCHDRYAVPLTAEFFQDELVKCLGLPASAAWKAVRAKIGGSKMTLKAFQRLVMKGLILHLRTESSGKDLLVANTHLFWHPNAKHIRIIQVAMLLATVEALRHERFPDAEIVLCGDLNSMPGGAVYEFLTTGSLAAAHADWKDCSIFNKEKLKDAAALETLMQLIEDFESDTTFGFDLAGAPLLDACAHWDASAHTNYTPTFKARLDYIFHSQGVACLRTLKNPAAEAMGVEVALPSSVFPSDHVAVVADLVM